MLIQIETDRISLIAAEPAERDQLYRVEGRAAEKGLLCMVEAPPGRRHEVEELTILFPGILGQFRPIGYSSNSG